MVLENVKDKIRVYPSRILPKINDIAHELLNDLELDEAFLICDLGDIVKKHLQWKICLPRVKPFYAVKSNDDVVVLKTLKYLGTGFDCASKGEIAKVLEMGAEASDIIYANPTKPPAHIRAARKWDVDLMTFDNEWELHKIKNLYPEARLVIRIRCDNEKGNVLAQKFGASVSEAIPLLKIAWAMGVNVVGVSFHVGSPCNKPEKFYDSIQSSRRIFDSARDIGYHFTLLDLGGGMSGEDSTNFKAVADVVNESLCDFFPEDCGVDIIAEPGRYYTQSAFTLVSQVHSIREVQTEENSSPFFMYYINDGIYGSLIRILIDADESNPDRDRPETLLKKSGPLYESCIWGPTLDGLDKVCDEIFLPKLQLGDWILFKNMGAYTLVAATTFNSLPIPQVYYVAPQDTWNLMQKIAGKGSFVMEKSCLKDYTKVATRTPLQTAMEVQR